MDADDPAEMRRLYLQHRADPAWCWGGTGAYGPHACGWDQVHTPHNIDDTTCDDCGRTDGTHDYDIEH